MGQPAVLFLTLHWQIMKIRNIKNCFYFYNISNIKKSRSSVICGRHRKSGKKMYSLLLAVIYLAFISLGLPDSLLGAAWPALYPQLGVPVSYAGIITFIIACGTVISSLMSDRVTRRFGAGKVTAFSVFLTMAALFGFSFSNHFWMLCILALPYGLGAGSVDAALNNFVALHYTQRHMHWLHCFWGVGVSISPYIMSHALVSGAGWQAGYREVGILQAILTVILCASLPLWNKVIKSKSASEKDTGDAPERRALGLRDALAIPGVKEVLAGFFGYCALESVAGLWASSYLVLYRKVPVEEAARFGALFFLGVTFGRMLSGLVANYLSDRGIVRIGFGLIFTGVILMLIPVEIPFPALAGLVVIGLGCAPVYPAIIHETPSNFGPENSQAIIGMQMAGAYVGTTLMPPVFGFIAGVAGFFWYPFFMLLILGFMVFMLEWKSRIIPLSRQAQITEK